MLPRPFFREIALRLCEMILLLADAEQICKWMPDTLSR